jgi:hypothetical protein
MTQSIRQAIGELQSQLKFHQDTATRLTRAIENLRDLVDIDKGAEPAKPKPVTKRKRRKLSASKAKPKASAAKGKKEGKRPTLARALRHVLEEHRKAKTRGVNAKQLFDEIQTAGFRFGGTNHENNMNYLYKTLRRNNAFKRTGDGLYGLV